MTWSQLKLSWDLRLERFGPKHFSACLWQKFQLFSSILVTIGYIVLDGKRKFFLFVKRASFSHRWRRCRKWLRSEGRLWVLEGFRRARTCPTSCCPWSWLARPRTPEQEFSDLLNNLVTYVLWGAWYIRNYDWARQLELAFPAKLTS